MQIIERATTSNILLKRCERAQAEVGREMLSTAKFNTIGDMSPQDIRKLNEIQNKLILSNKYAEIAERSEKKFSNALEVITNISEAVATISGTLANTNALDDVTRPQIQAEINNVLQIIEQELNTPYDNGYLFSSDNISNTKLSDTIIINTALDSGAPAITGIKKALNDILQQVNDRTMGAISVDLRSSFMKAQSSLSGFQIDIFSRRENAERAIEINNASMTSTQFEFEQMTEVSEDVKAHHITDIVQHINNMKSLLLVDKNMPNLFDPR